MPVLDASALTSIYVLDEHHERIVRWLRSAELPMHLPAIAIAEMAGALARRGTPASRAIDAAIADVLSDPLFRLHPVSPLLAQAAASVARTFRLKGCDAIYVALAQELDDVLVTFDAEQLERAAGAVRVLRPD